MRSSGEIVYVAVGANLGDREATFSATIHALEAEPEMLLLGASPVFETPPLGPSGQDPYLNAVLELRAWLSPHELLSRLQSIEDRLGRARRSDRERWGPREIDLDILFFGDRCIESPELVVPHAHAHERVFVLAPMAEIAPAFVHPRLGVSIRELVRAMADLESVVRWRRPPGWPGAATETPGGGDGLDALR